jgi:PEP-CTERM motif
MRSILKKWLGAATMGLALVAGSAHAANLQNTGGSFSALSGDFNPTWLTGSETLLSQFDLASVLRGATLSVSAPVGLQFTLLGYEAGYNNALVVGNQNLTNRNGLVSLLGNTLNTEVGSAGVLDFGFLSNNTGNLLANGSQSVGVVMAANQQSALLLFNDLYVGDTDFDDMVVYMSISHAPEPAMVSMLLAGLGLVAVGARRQKRVNRLA